MDPTDILNQLLQPDEWELKCSSLTDLVSTGVEEVAQADNVAVVQLPHDLQLTILRIRNKTVIMMTNQHGVSGMLL